MLLWGFPSLVCCICRVFEFKALTAEDILPAVERGFSIMEQRLGAQAMADATAENLKAQAAQEAAEGPEDLSDTAEFPPAPQAEEEPEEEPVHGTRRIDFGNLQFGRDYEIK